MIIESVHRLIFSDAGQGLPPANDPNDRIFSLAFGAALVLVGAPTLYKLNARLPNIGTQPRFTAFIAGSGGVLYLWEPNEDTKPKILILRPILRGMSLAACWELIRGLKHSLNTDSLSAWHRLSGGALLLAGSDITYHQLRHLRETA